MMNAQLRLNFDLPSIRNRKATFFVWQPEVTDAVPWCVLFDGRTNGYGDVTIYHQAIPKGKVTFPRLRLETPERFVDFVASMLKVYQGFGGFLKIRPQDLRALQDGYKKGVYEAQREYKKTF